jgi:hypothetical protein
MTEIECRELTILRKNLQGGISNDEFDIKDLLDWRFLHNHPTYAVKRWKDYESFRRDAKHTDLRSRENTNVFAEGKNISKDLNLNPSVSVGAGRTFDAGKLEECLSKNSHYFLYRLKEGSLDDMSLTIEIFWVPIDVIRKWYSANGNGKGIINGAKLTHCLNQYEIVRTQETRD